MNLFRASFKQAKSDWVEFGLHPVIEIIIKLKVSQIKVLKSMFMVTKFLQSYSAVLIVIKIGSFTLKRYAQECG